MRLRVLALLIAAVAGCPSAKHDDKTAPVTFRVAAASDVSRAFTDVGKAFTAETGLTPVFDFTASGLLAKQIEQGAPFALFAAANKSFAEQVANTGACDAKTLAMYSRGHVIVWGKARSPTTLGALVDPAYRRIAIANPDTAPYGKAAVQALHAAGIYDQIKDRLVLAESVQQAHTYAMEGSVDVAIAARSLAVSNDDKGYLDVDLRMYEPLEQTLVVCGAGPQADAAKKFAAFILSDKGQAIMAGFGFSK